MFDQTMADSIVGEHLVVNHTQKYLSKTVRKNCKASSSHTCVKP